MKYVYCKCGASGLSDDNSTDDLCPDCENPQDVGGPDPLDADATIRDNDALGEFIEAERSE